MIQTGEVVGDYRVLELIGSGGMGAVYKIEHVITKRIEAMKALPAGFASGPEEERRFEREIQVHARLQHPHIASLYNAVRDGRSIALIMEYVEGESLARKLERGALELRTAVDYAGQVLDALAYAHAKGVVHHDVTPANIIITGEGAAKLTDFGLARAATDIRLSTSGAAAGSPWYMSPEQVRGAADADARTDLYSLGAVLYEMLTGRKLFDTEGSFAIMCAHVETVPRPPSAHNSALPKALDGVIGKALAKDPAARFQSAGEFRLAMDAAVRAPASTAGRSRVLIARVLASSTLAAVLVAGMFGHSGARRASPAPREAAKLVAPAPPPPAIVVAETPEPQPAPVATDTPAPEPAPATVRSARPAIVPERAHHAGIRITGGTVEPPSAPTLPDAPVLTPASAPDVPALKVDPAPPPETAAQAAEAAPPKSGNRFVRALGKLNPFRKRAPDPAKPPAKE